MNEFVVLPFRREGAWHDTYSGYYRFAWDEFQCYQHVVAHIQGEEARLLFEIGESELTLNLKKMYVAEKLAAEHKLAYRHATSCHIYACMTLEGFLNAYGVRRLGENFYQRNLERTSIVEKLALIGACCQQWTITPDSEILRDMRHLFDGRNRLVHPKSKEFRMDKIKNYLYVHPADLPANEVIDILERCIDFFVDLDRSINRDFYFSRKSMSEWTQDEWEKFNLSRSRGEVS